MTAVPSERESARRAGGALSCVTRSPESQPCGLRAGRGGPTPPIAPPAHVATRPTPRATLRKIGDRIVSGRLPNTSGHDDSRGLVVHASGSFALCLSAAGSIVTQVVWVAWRRGGWQRGRGCAPAEWDPRSLRAARRAAIQRL